MIEKFRGASEPVRMLSTVQLNKIKELESLCPQATISYVYGDDKVHITSPTVDGDVTELVVVLSELGEDFDTWIDKEIASRRPFPVEKSPYRLICPIHGPTLITLENYNSQMSRQDLPWVCPICGTVSPFDDDYYEEHSPIVISVEEYADRYNNFLKE